MSSRPPAAAAGFSLLEVLVAFTILALSLGVLFNIFSGGLGNVSAADQYTRAMIIGESKLAALGIEEPLEEGGKSGEAAGGYQWSITVAPYHDDDENEIDEQNDRGGLYEIEVVVRWPTRPGERRLSLKTLRLVAKP